MTRRPISWWTAQLVSLAACAAFAAAMIAVTDHLQGVAS